jgi:hypothetical protein
MLRRRVQYNFSWLDDEILPELASDADSGVIIDYDDSLETFVDGGRFGLLMAGVWVECMDVGNQCWRAQRLGWVSPVDGRHFFMDSRGITVAVCSPREVAAQIDSGRLRIIEPLGCRALG